MARFVVPGRYRLFPAAGDSSRNHGETHQLAGLVAQGPVDTAVPQLLVAVDAARVHAQENRHFCR